MLFGLALNHWEASLDEAQRLVPAVVHVRNAAQRLPLSRSSPRRGRASTGR